MTSIRCHHYKFTLRDRFSAGHLLSENEAAALNALRAENIRNILLLRLRKVARDDGTLLSPEQVLELELEASRLDREYEFGARRAYSRPGPLQVAEREIARQRVLSKARSDGRALSPEDLESLTATEADTPAVKEEARLRVEEQGRVARGALDSLLGNDE